MWASGQLGRFILLCIGVWLHAADMLVMATIVPAIVADLGGVAYVSWTIALYQIGAVVAGAAAALFCRRLGIRAVLLAAALLYAVGCVMAAIAPAMALLVAARLVQGIGGGMLVSLSYVAIQQLFAAHLWGRLFGVVAAIWAAGSLLGPLIGGLFAHGSAWRVVFWLFALQALILAVAAAILVPVTRGEQARAGRLPLRPMIALAAATLLIAQAGVVASLAASLVLCIAGTALLYLAARLDRQAEERMLPRQGLEPDQPLSAGLLLVFALSVATTGFWAYGPLLLEILFGTHPLVSGYILAGEALAWSAATMLVAGVAASRGPLLIRLGASLVVLGAAGYAVSVPAGSFTGMVACGLLQGVGFGLSWPSIVQRTVLLAPPAEGMLAAAAPGTVQRIGYAVGAAFTGIVANGCGLAAGVSADAARQAGFWVFAAFLPVLGCGLVAAWRFTAERAATSTRS